MSKILDLTNEQAALDDQLYFCDDPEQYNDILRQQVANHSNIVSALVYLTDILKEQDAQAKAKEGLAKEVKARAVTAKNKHESLKNFIKMTMIANDIKKIEGAYCTLSIQKGRETCFYPEDFDYSTLPPDFVKLVPESWVPDKLAVNKALKDGFTFCNLPLIRGEDIMVVR